MNSETGKPQDEAERQGNKAENDLTDQVRKDPAGDHAARKGEGSERDPQAGATARK